MPFLLLLVLGGIVAAASRRPSGSASPAPVGGGLGGGGTAGPPALPAPVPFTPKPVGGSGSGLPTGFGVGFVPAGGANSTPPPVAIAPTVPSTPRDPFGILGPLGATPAIDALPEPQRTNVKHAIAYGTDPAALRSLADALQAIGATAAANEVRRAADLLQGSSGWPEIAKLAEPYKTRGQSLVNGLDYFTLFDLSKPFCKRIQVPDYAAIGEVPANITDPSAGAIASVQAETGGTPEQARATIYNRYLAAKFPAGVPMKDVPSPACPQVADLTTFLTGLNAAGVIGGWTAELGSAIARLRGETGST